MDRLWLTAYCTCSFLKLRRLASAFLKYPRLREIVLRVRYLLWIMNGRPIPLPALVKQATIKEVGQVFNLPILVETGTYYGDTVNAVRSVFREIYSIELGAELYNAARRRFSRFRHIHILHGDSQRVLPDILARISEPCLFWLDAHYSGGITAKGDLETPIMQELRIISKHNPKSNVILIDDARCFNGERGYPKFQDLKSYIEILFPAANIEVENDIVRVYVGGKTGHL